MADFLARALAIRALLAAGTVPPPPPIIASTRTEIIQGGTVLWESAYTFRVQAATYYINGALIQSAEQTITLNAADATNDRIDILVLNTSGVLQKITGVAAAQPSEPDLDPATQIKVTFVFVAANTVAPGQITNENIFQEGVEWTATTSGSGINVNSTNQPYAGTKSIEATNMAADAYALFTRSSNIALEDYDTLALFIKSKANWSGQRQLRLQWLNANNQVVGQPVTLASGFWSFNAATTTAYQFVAIPLGNFIIPPGNAVRKLRIMDSGGAIGFYMDSIILQAYGQALAPPAQNDGVSQAEADARYLQRENNLADLKSVASALANLGLYYTFTFFFTTPPTASEVLFIHPVTEAVTLPANFASPNSKAGVGTNPTSSFAIDVQRQVNGAGAFSTIGTITIATNGAVTFATSGGTAKTLAIGDVLKFVAPVTPDATVANCSFTIRAAR